VETDDGYPRQLLLWVERLEELESIRAQARARPQPDVVIMPRALTDFVAIALASGIIGNIGYDAIKAALRAWRRPRLRLPQRARDMHDAALVAVLATQARCAQVDLPVPALEELEVVQCERLTDRWRVELRRTERGRYRYGDRPWPEGVALGAAVVIPDGPLDGHDVEVTVVAKGELDAAIRAEYDRIQAFIDRLHPPGPGQPGR
jgi:hypothetical protein